MGQARSRGSFEERRAGAIRRRQEELTKTRQERQERPAPAPIKRANQAYPLATAFMMANAWVIYPPRCP